MRKFSGGELLELHREGLTNRDYRLKKSVTDKGGVK